MNEKSSDPIIKLRARSTLASPAISAATIGGERGFASRVDQWGKDHAEVDFCGCAEASAARIAIRRRLVSMILSTSGLNQRAVPRMTA